MWKSLNDISGNRNLFEFHNKKKNCKMLALNRSYQISSTIDDNKNDDNMKVKYIIFSLKANSLALFFILFYN
jgi:hypothetical protein